MAAATTSRPAGIGEKFVKAIIDKEGNVKIEAHGFKDGQCIKATASFEKALGIGGQRTMTGGGCQQQHLNTGV